MALLAVAAELVLVHISVAIGTTGKSDSGEFLDLFSIYGLDFMAFDAFHIPVLSQ